MDVILIYYVISVLAICVMAMNVYKAFNLKKSIVGGELGEKWNYSFYLIIFFFIGYIVSPLILRINPEYKDIVISLVFLFGAIFVLIMISILISVITVFKVKK
jgi:hypothetical protein